MTNQETPIQTIHNTMPEESENLPFVEREDLIGLKIGRLTEEMRELKLDRHYIENEPERRLRERQTEFTDDRIRLIDAIIKAKIAHNAEGQRRRLEERSSRPARTRHVDTRSGIVIVPSDKK